MYAVMINNLEQQKNIIILFCLFKQVVKQLYQDAIIGPNFDVKLTALAMIIPIIVQISNVTDGYAQH